LQRWYRRPSRLAVACLVALVLSAGIFEIHSRSYQSKSTLGIRIDSYLQITANGIPVAAGGWTVSSCPATNRWVCSLILNGVVLNTTTVVFPGQTVQVNLWIEYLKGSADPQTVTLRAVTIGDGFQMTKAVGPIPQNMTGWASQGGLTLYLRVLDGAQSGKISVSERFSA
jgi:hypothetical protein